ncbi:MAG TPA: hypothetical protein VIF12_02690, partial [Micavibrio sp.]
MTVLAASALGGAIPEAQAGGDSHGGLQLSVKVMQYGAMPLSSNQRDAGTGHGIFNDDHGTGHSTSAKAEGHHDLPPTAAQNYYESIKKETGGHADSGHEGKSSHSGRMASFVVGYGGTYGDASGFVNVVQDNHGKLSLYDLRGTIHASANGIFDTNYHLGPINDFGITARIDHAHGPDHAGSLRYAVGPGVDFYDGALRVNAFVRDDLNQPGITGQMSATWNMHTKIAGGRDAQFSGYAD